MQEIERSAESVEEAIEAALDELGVSEQEARVEIVQEPKAGFLGLRAQEAVVRVRVRGAGPAADEDEPDDLEEQGEIAAEFMEGLLERMGIEVTVEPKMFEGSMYVDLVAAGENDDMALLIGRHGQTLEAMQELVRVAVGRQIGSRCRVLVDVEDYRKRRRSRLAAKAKDIAERVQRTGREQALEPMNAYERKIVHDAVASVGGVQSESRGEDPERRVVIRRAP